MRLKSKPPIIIKDGETRIVNRFLWFPVLIKREIRWLEYAAIKQKFHDDYGLDGEDCSHWENMAFIDT